MTFEEFRRLRENILKDRVVRDPLVVWKGKNILLDGHNRWRIIQENPAIPYSITEMEFENEWEALVWVCRNQLGRRNMTPLQQAKLIQEEHDAMQRIRGGDHRSEDFQSGENHHFEKTRTTVAREHGITENAVRDAVSFGRGLDVAEEAVPGFKEEVLTEKVKVNKADVAALRKMDPEEIPAAVEEIKRGKRVRFPSAPNYKKSYAGEEGVEYGISRDVNAVVVYTLDLLVEELEALNEDFLRKYTRVLDMRRDVATDNADTVLGIMNALTDKFDELKEILE